MPRYAVLLRGVNVGRGNRVPMAELRALLESLGATGVRTLLNSGNAVFASPVRAGASLAKKVRAALVERLGVDVPVVVVSAAEMAAIAAGNTLGSVATDPSRLLVVFPAEAGATAGLEAVRALVRPPERLVIGRQARARVHHAQLGNRGKAPPAAGPPRGTAMIEPPQVVQVASPVTAVIRSTLPRRDVRRVMGPAIPEPGGVVAAQGAGPEWDPDASKWATQLHPPLVRTP